MTLHSQLALDFDHRPALTGEDFLVAPPNAEAVAWLDRWPGWPGPALVVHGPPGCGKTHLAMVFMSLSGGRLVAPDQLRTDDPPDIFGDAPALVLDDAQSFLGQEEALLHLYNTALETGRHMMLTSDSPPSRWTVRLADLGSRLNSASSVGIGEPDDALISAVLVKLFADRQLKVEEGVIGYMLTRMERSFEAARRLVEAVDAKALAERRNITVKLVSSVMQGDDGNP